VALVVDAQALVVHFGDFTSGPSDTLQVGGVTVSVWTGFGGGFPPTGQPATVLGAGLGAALIGPNYTIDRQLSFEAGSYQKNRDHGDAPAQRGRHDQLADDPAVLLGSGAG
jgi:hypothetical protein